MNRRYYGFSVLVFLVVSTFFLSGCAVNFYKQSPRSKKKIEALQTKVNELEALRRQEQDRFEEVKRMLESKLRDQISNDQVSLMDVEGGIAIVLSDNVLFDSGKAQLKEDAFPVLNKVADIITSKVPDKNIGVAGHTDNVPITHSSWKSNWELSTARATNVLHYLLEKGVLSERLSATGYGENRPVASNSTSAGRARNRRVEIVILPEYSQERSEGADFTGIK